MKSIQIYGIKNCDTMKKTLRWLDENNIAYDFHDYKKTGVDQAVISQAIDQHGWQVVINRRGTTWRSLDEGMKNTMDSKTALKAAVENPSMIKRPLLVYKGDSHLGFDPDQYSKIVK